MIDALDAAPRPATGVAVRPAVLGDDAAFIVSAVQRHLNPAADLARFDWLYRRNPDGEARAWIAEDAAGRAVGLAAAFPRRVIVQGREGRGWVLGDFCVDDDYRTLGPALQLQRACLAGVMAAGADVVYDLPGPRMLPVYRRIGIAPAGSVRRLARLLRVDGRVPRRLPAVVTRAANALLALADARHAGGRGVEVAAESAPYGREYTELASRAGAHHGFCIHRSAAYLDWRYGTAPHRPYRLLAARRRGVLQGYVVLDRDGAAGWIVDLFVADDDATVMRALVAAAVARCRADGAATVSAIVLDGQPAGPALMRLGFSPREAGPLVACDGNGRPLLTTEAAGSPWLLTQGDRES
jgi:hypothetical protein